MYTENFYYKLTYNHTILDPQDSKVTFVCMVIVAVIAVLGNILTLAAFITNKSKLLVKYNISILSLTIADLLVGIDCVFLAWNNREYLDKVLPEEANLKNELIQVVIYACKIFPILVACSHVVFIAFERHVAVVYPIYYRLEVTSKKLIVTIACTYVIVFLLAFGHAIFSTCVYFKEDKTLFLQAVNYTDVYFIILEFMCFVLAVVDICLMYVCVVWRTNHIGYSLKKGQRPSKVSKAGSKIWKLSLVIVVVFTITWTPYFVCCFISMVGFNIRAFELRAHLSVFGFSNSAVNFFIYAVMNKNFRNAYKSMLCFCRHVRKDSLKTQSLETISQSLENQI